MGYYSDVGLALTARGKMTLQQKLAMPGTDGKMLNEVKVSMCIQF